MSKRSYKIEIFTAYFFSFCEQNLEKRPIFFEKKSKKINKRKYDEYLGNKAFFCIKNNKKTYFFVVF